MSKRIKKPDLGGRPTIEESTTLTSEMEEFAHLSSRGNSIFEIATLMKIKAERAARFANTPIIQERIKILQSDLSEIADKLEDELGVVLLENFLKKARSGDLDNKDMKWLLERIWKMEGKLVDSRSKGNPNSMKKNKIKKPEAKKPIFESVSAPD